MTATTNIHKLRFEIQQSALNATGVKKEKTTVPIVYTSCDGSKQALIYSREKNGGLIFVQYFASNLPSVRDARTFRGVHRERKVTIRHMSRFW